MFVIYSFCNNPYFPKQGLAMMARISRSPFFVKYGVTTGRYFPQTHS
jgi:hypothetical protein